MNNQKHIKNFVILVMSIMTIFTFFFPVVSIGNYLNINANINGFYFLKFREFLLEENLTYLIIGLLTILQMCFSVLSIVLSIENCIYKETKLRPVITIMAIVFFIDITYFIEYFVVKSYDDYSYLYETKAYIPLIISLILGIIYFAIHFTFKEVNQQSENEISNNIDSSKLELEQKKMEILKNYKDMLEQGLITKEDFDKKKNEIINN